MIATVIKTKSAQSLGQYIPTAVDAARDAADIRIVGYCRNRTEIETRKKLLGGGVKLTGINSGVARYLVTDEVMTELRRRYSIATDL